MTRDQATGFIIPVGTFDLFTFFLEEKKQEISSNVSGNIREGFIHIIDIRILCETI